MQKEEHHPEDLDKALAGVCGLYCEACTLFIATKEDPARLEALAEIGFPAGDERLLPLREGAGRSLAVTSMTLKYSAMADGGFQ